MRRIALLFAGLFVAYGSLVAFFPETSVSPGDLARGHLQQCADAVMRLRAEWLWASGQRERVAFHFTSGDLAAWPAWRAGERPFVVGSYVRWMKRAAADDSYAAFRSYLETVFRYAGSGRS